MDKKQTVVNLIILCLCFATTPAFAKSNFVHHITGRHHASLRSGSEFSKVSANFNTPSFTINSDNTVFSRPTDNFNRPAVSMAVHTGEFSELSFPIQ